MCKVVMRADKETKGTIRFAETVEKGKDPIIGMIYIPKRTLEIAGWEPGKEISIDLSIVAEEKQEAPAPAESDKVATAAVAAPAKKTRATKTAAAKKPGTRGRKKKVEA